MTRNNSATLRNMICFMMIFCDRMTQVFINICVYLCLFGHNVDRTSTSSKVTAFQRPLPHKRFFGVFLKLFVAFLLRYDTKYVIIYL